jgi:hypothetical protein
MAHAEDNRQRGITGALLASLLVPLAGFVLGVAYLLRERVGRGLALIFVGWVCLVGWAFVMTGALAVGTEHVLNEDLKHLRVREAKEVVRGTHTAARVVFVRTGTEPLAEWAKHARARERQADEREWRALERSIASGGTVEKAQEQREIIEPLKRQIERLRARESARAE